MAEPNRPSWASRPFKDDRGGPPKAPAIWCNVKKLPKTAHSDLILKVKVPSGNDLGMPEGEYVAFLEWRDEPDWKKYTGSLKKDQRPPQKGGSEWAKKQESRGPDNIPF